MPSPLEPVPGAAQPKPNVRKTLDTTGEIASLTWDMVVDGGGQIGNVIELRDHAAKKGSGRLIPIHPDLAAALSAWRQISKPSANVISSQRGGAMTPLSIVVWFNRAFKNIGLKGCSSHSGRRTFVTRAARMVHTAGGSLRDVQLLGRPPLDPDDPAVHRRRHRCPAQARVDDLIWPFPQHAASSVTAGVRYSNPILADHKLQLSIMRFG